MRYYQHHPDDFEAGRPIGKLPMVYVISSPDLKIIKIGKTTAFKKRLQNIQSGCPFRLSLWIAARTPKPSAVESELHRLLKHCNLRGEWFSPSEDDLDLLSDFISLTNKDVRETLNALLQA